MKVRYDTAQRTVLAVCACGWRHLALGRPEAVRAARAHEQRAHPGDTDTVTATRRAVPK